MTVEPQSIDFQYDANGNLLYENDNLLNDDVRTYTYNAENRLTKIQNQQ